MLCQSIRIHLFHKVPRHQVYHWKKWHMLMFHQTVPLLQCQIDVHCMLYSMDANRLWIHLFQGMENSMIHMFETLVIINGQRQIIWLYYTLKLQLNRFQTQMVVGIGGDIIQRIMRLKMGNKSRLYII